MQRRSRKIPRMPTVTMRPQGFSRDKHLSCAFQTSACRKGKHKQSKIIVGNFVPKGLLMEYTNLGSTGTRVSRLCLGCMTYGAKQWREWVLDEEQGRPFIKRALELGFNFFDTADMYSLGRSE